MHAEMACLNVAQIVLPDLESHLNHLKFLQLERHWQDLADFSDFSN